jgi:5-methylcytosine-specific restriction endonuclease McrA
MPGGVVSAYEVDWDAGTENRWDEHRDRFQPDPKPTKRYRATAGEWKTIRREFQRETCRICGKPWNELHHIMSRGQSGDDVSVNLAPLCSDCHRAITNRDQDARAVLGTNLTPENLGYLRYKLGQRADGWLARNYGVAA